jgi:hypothetical protein
LTAVTTKVAAEALAVGVPLMLPLVAFKVSPAGSPGFIDHVTTAPPPVVGVTVCAVTPRVYAYEGDV